jgi:hypothetical protein
VPPIIVVPDSWSAESNGTSITVRMGTTAPKAGEQVRFVFEYSSEYPCCDLLVDFGDGSGFQDDAGVTCPEDPPRTPGGRRVTTTHTYASAGTFLVTVGVVAHARCVFPFPEFHSASVSGAVVAT